MKAVITGSNGFIGTALLNKLADAGASVRCLVRSDGPTEVVSNISWHGINYADPDSLIRSGALHDADVVFHVAGVTKHLNIEGFRKGNVMPTQQLVDALKTLDTPLKRFVLISSQAAAGPAPDVSDPIDESVAPAPIELYGRSKLEAENVLRNADLPFDYTVIRPAAVYGPRDVDFLTLFKQLKSGIGIYPGNRDSYVSAIHVDDLVNGIIEAATHDKARNQTYFLTREVALSWQEIYEHIVSIWGSTLREVNLPFGLIELAGKVGDVYSRATGKITVLNSNKIDLARPRYWICSSEKAIADFNFAPDIAIPDGLAHTFNWYKEAGWL